MQQFLPSKRFVYTAGSIIVAILIVIGVQSLANWQNTRRLADESAGTSATNQKNLTTKEFLAIDSDADGMKDWEESLWKTNPKKADTDNDGTTDSEEIRNERDPLKANTASTGAAPTDKVDPAIIAENKKTQEDFAKLSETDQLSRTLFSQYIAAKGNGALNETDKQIIINTALATIDSATSTKYSLSNLAITTTVGSSTRKKYGNDLGQAFFTGTSATKVENELIVIDRAVKNSDEKELAGLDPIIEGYSKTVSKILLITVPADAVEIHLNLLNDLSAIREGLQKIKSLFTDPLQSVAGMKEYQNGSANLVKDTADLKNYFFDHGVVFDSKEYGYVLVNII